MTNPARSQIYDMANVDLPKRITTVDDVTWDAAFDVVVVGFGGAGVAAAIEARDKGLTVAAVDRFEGGGATATSGSVFYCGGGTPLQQKLGVTDTPTNMFNYLREEVQGVVADETLKRFCDQSVENYHWAEANGVRFGGAAYTEKTTYPPHGFGLYFSGNELVEARKAVATSAQRGHVAQGISRFSAFGPAFYAPLKKAALKKGVELVGQSRAQRLVQDETGAIVGVEVQQVAGPWARLQHRLYNRICVKAHMYYAPLADNLRKRIKQIEAAAEPKLLRAQKGVVLSAGGFIFNRDMVAEYAPTFKRALRLGTTGDDGSGIALGDSAGGALDRMDHCSAWRFINPPANFPKAILVNRQGERYVDETMYGASIGEPMFKQHDGQAILIMDSPCFEEAKTQVSSKTARPVTILQTRMSFKFAVTAPTLEALATKIKMDAVTLSKTVDAYNEMAAGEAADPFGKAQKNMLPISEGPFYAVDMSVGRGGVTPCITLGGLKVDEATGQVLDEAGQGVPGLYAAGRTAIGVASNIYVSGLSIADCVFSGRRAGAAIAESNKD
ncbi:MAG: FAD-binding protein [Alphaproteobacteria bacterium]